MVLGTSVTPTTTVTTTEGSMTYTYRSPCEATTTDGCYVKKNQADGGLAALALRPFMLVLLMLAMFGIAVADVETVSPGLLVADLSKGIDLITSMEDSGNVYDTYMLVLDDKVYGISNFSLDSNLTLKKRWDGGNAPLGASWTQHQVAQQGHWWSDWYPASCVHQNEKGSTPINIELTQSMSYSASWNAGFDIGFGEKASLSIGYTTTRTNSKSEVRKYTVPAYDYGQVWQQQQMIWQDQQHQHCHKYNYGSHGIKCGAWSEYIRGNIPVKNGHSFGWSTGKQNMNFNSCGGGN